MGGEAFGESEPVVAIDGSGANAREENAEEYDGGVTRSVEYAPRNFDLQDQQEKIFSAK
jgi:hypothetical protein